MEPSPVNSYANMQNEITHHDEKDNILVKVVTAKGRQAQRTCADHAILRFFCVRGIPPANIESDEFRDIFIPLCPKYIPPSRTQLEDVLIPAEATHVRKQQMRYLSTQTNLTITFDGGSTRAQESFYTFHVTTAARRSFFLKAYPGSGAIHNAQFIADIAIEVCLYI